MYDTCACVRVCTRVCCPLFGTEVVDPAGVGARYAQAGEGAGEGAGGTDEADVDTARSARDGAAPADGAAAPPVEVGDRLEQQHAQRGGSCFGLVCFLFFLEKIYYFS